MEVLSDEQKATISAFLQRALLHFLGLGVQIQKLLADNGYAYHPREFKTMPGSFGLKYSQT